MQSLKINPIVGFMVNYLCPVLLVYLGGFLHSKPLIEWPLGNFFQKKEVIVPFRPLLILLDETPSLGQSIIPALTLAINTNIF